MIDSELVKRELAVYGILYKDEEMCSVINGGDRFNMTLPAEQATLQKSIASNKQLFSELWGELMEMLASPPMTISPGGESTGRMFTEALKHMLRIAVEHGNKRAKLVIRNQLKRDINCFSESFMTKIIDYKIGLDWVHHLVQSDRYRLRLLAALVASHRPKEVTAIQGPWANLDLPMKERVWDYNEESGNLEDRDSEKQKQQRYQIPDTYNDPYSFEEGFYYREMRNEPYAFDDEDNNPYPHRNNLWE